MNSAYTSLSSVLSVAKNVVHTVFSIAIPARLVPAGLTNVHGAMCSFTPSSVATNILPLDTTLIWSFKCISPINATPAGIIISLAYTPAAEYTTASICAPAGLAFKSRSKATSLCRL